jgi:microcystin-dependent protein
MEPTVGQIILFAGDFAPRYWEFCNGQLLSISQNQELFSVIGTTYGGDGRSSFALPDLRGSVPIGSGSPPNGHQVNLGQKQASQTVEAAAGDSRRPVYTLPSLALNYIIAVKGIYPDRR